MTPDSPAVDAPPAPRLWGGLRTVSALTLVSRVLGLLRDAAMAAQFGAGPVMDAFTIAFRIPNLFRRLFGEGALATSFVPVLARELAHRPRTEVWRLTSAVIGLLSLFLAALIVPAMLLILLWAELPGQTAENVWLLWMTALLLPYVISICVACQVGAALNALGHFTWPAVVPIVLNAVWLAALWGLAPRFASPVTQAYALGVAILAAGVLQVAVQWPALRAFGFRFTTDWRPAWPGVREVLWTMGPVVVGLSITQINTFADSFIAWSFSQPVDQPAARLAWLGLPFPLASGAVSSLYYGERLYQFPVGVFGVALGTVLFPRLAGHAARGELHLLRDDLGLGLRLVLAIGIPGSVGLMWLAAPIARALFERGAFDPAATARTATIIAAYGSGVWAYCGLLILQRGFYAVGDRATPLRIGLVSVACNLVLNLLLIWPFAESGMAWSTALCAAGQVGGLTWALQHRVGRLAWRPIGRACGKTLLATAVLLAAGAAAQLLLARAGLDRGKLLGLGVPLLAGSGAFVAAAWVLKLDELRMLLRRGG